MPEVYAAHTLHVNASQTSFVMPPYRESMEPHEETRKTGLGARLKAARTIAQFTQEAVANALGLKKATVSSWETGRNIPDALTLGHLAKLYGTTADALIWDDSVSIEAIRFAVQYDALSDKLRRNFQAMWLAYFAEATSDVDVASNIRVTVAQEREKQRGHLIQDRSGTAEPGTDIDRGEA